MTKFSPAIKDYSRDRCLVVASIHIKACQIISTHRTEDPRVVGEALIQDRLVTQHLLDRVLCLILTNRCLMEGISHQVGLNMAILQVHHLLPLSRRLLREPTVLNSWSL
jgi:hypothetical protein